VIVKKAKAGCKCSRSQCLKKYCVCFSAGRPCTDACLCCDDCLNTDEVSHSDDNGNCGHGGNGGEDILVADQEGEDDENSANVKLSSPKFVTEKDRLKALAKKKREKILSSNQAPNEFNVTCNCSRSNCLKQYCACFRAGFACLPSCRCADCMNNKDPWFMMNTANAEAVHAAQQSAADAATGVAAITAESIGDILEAEDVDNLKNNKMQ